MNTDFNEKAGKDELRFSPKMIIVRFFGFVLSLAMMISCSSAGHIFASDNLAAIGEKSYVKISEAIAAAGENDTVKLLPRADGSPVYGCYTVLGKKNIMME